jgi:hypothetical protein
VTTQGAGVVTGFLRSHFGALDVSAERVEGGLMRWCVGQPEQRGFELVATDELLRAAHNTIERWLAALVEDVMAGAPAPPAYYHLSVEGLTVRGISEVVLESHGQRIRCWIDIGPLAGAAGGGAAAPTRRWCVELDGAQAGVLMRAEASDSRDDVAERAVAFLKSQGALRVPDPPWQWSVLDAGGGEWWARLTPPWHAERGESQDRQLVLRERATGRERRVPWAEGKAPDADALRRLLAE